MPATQRRPPPRRPPSGGDRTPRRRPPARGAAGLRAAARRLVERRIGLLFALFLLLLGLAALRATWLGTVRAGSLSERAVSQQIEDLAVDARRGTITDRNGIELAVSEDSVTVFAHPFLIDDPARVAQRLAPLIGRSRGRAAARSCPIATPASSTCGARWTPPWARRSSELGIEGIGTVVEPKRTYPQGYLASQVLGMVGTDNVGLSGLEYSARRSCTARTASAGWSRTRWASR